MITTVIASERSNFLPPQGGRKIGCFVITLALIVFIHPKLHASEVFQETNSQVIIREHPKTGKPYVVIASAGMTSETAFFLSSKKFSRPDYRLLNPKVKSGQIPYDGPYSDSKRIYIFAATLATLGTVGGAVGMAILPASTGAAATGGAGYLAAGGVVAAGTTAAVVTASKPKTDGFIQSSKSESIDHR